MPTAASRTSPSFLGLLLLGILAAVTACGDTKAMIADEEQPEQPIPFYHTIHAGQDSIPCQYCHSSAATSEEAGIPPVGTCMGCHRFIQGRTPEFEQNIQMLLGFWADSTAIPWERVHSVPSFVQFTHKPHVRAGVECAECHGEVAEMEVVRRVESLTMGWCIECHRDQGAPDDCAACHY